MADKEPWLEIHDSQISSAELVAEIDKRVQMRREALGEVKLLFPTFGTVSPFPDPPSDRPYNPNLYHHLRQANEIDPPPTMPVLAKSPATQIPLIGRVWQMIRGQVHELILFYVNRNVAYQSKLDNHLISSLNELTRVVEMQREELDDLRQEVDELKKGQR